MTKAVLSDIVNPENQTSLANTINANNAVIETAFDNTLSRDGSIPNQMLNYLDMNSYPIINLPQPQSAKDAVSRDYVDKAIIALVPVTSTGIDSTLKLTTSILGLNLSHINTWTNGISTTVTDPTLLSVPVTTFLNGGDASVNNVTAGSIYSTLSSSPLSSQLGPAFIVQQIIGSGVSGSGAAGAIVGGFQNSKTGADAYGVLGIANNTATVTSPTGAALWGLVRGTHAGSSGVGFIDALRATSEVSNGSAGVANNIAITIASPAVISWTAHGLIAGDQVSFLTEGSLPTGLVVSAIYFVSATGLTANSFQISATSGGSSINTSGSQTVPHFAFSPQQPRAGLFITNNLISNPFLAGAYVESALQYGFRIGSGGTGQQIYEPTYPFAYTRKGGSQPFSITQDGVIHTTIGISMDAGEAGIVWPNDAFGVGIDFGLNSKVIRDSATGALTLSSQTGAVVMPKINMALSGVTSGGDTSSGITWSTPSLNFGIFAGTNAPTMSAGQGSLYLRFNGNSTSTRLYINTDGGTTWTNVVTGA